MKCEQRLCIYLMIILLALFCACEKKEQNALQPAKLFDQQMTGMKIKQTSVPITHEVVGTIAAKTSATLSCKISGIIKQVLVKEGDLVKAGDLLVVIDDRDISERLTQAKAAYESAQRGLDEIAEGIKQARSQEQQAQANLDLAMSTYKRYESLYQQKATSDQEFDTIKAKLDVAKAQLKSANQGIAQLQSKKAQVTASVAQAKSGVEEATIMKSYAQIQAPFDGIVVKKFADIGAMAAPGVPLINLENPNGFRLEVDVQESEFATKIQIGRLVDVKVDALGSQTIPAHVAEVVPSANPMSRTIRVKLALPDIQGIKSGMYGKALCPRGERMAILIPKSALIKRGQLEQVYTVEQGNIAHLRLVKTGKIIHDQIEILAGLSENDTIIVDPKPGLKDRYQVKVEVRS